MPELTDPKPSTNVCRYCSSAIRKVPISPDAPHPTRPLVLCIRCDRADLWPGHAQS